MANYSSLVSKDRYFKYSKTKNIKIHLQMTCWIPLYFLQLSTIDMSQTDKKESMFTCKSSNDIRRTKATGKPKNCLYYKTG